MKKNYGARISVIVGVAVLSAAMTLGGCGSTGNNSGQVQKDNVQANVTVQNSGGTEPGNAGSETGESGVTDTAMADQFTDRDFSTEYEEAECVLITLNGDGAVCDSKSVKTEGSTVIIQEKGSYILRGSLINGSICVEADKEDKVQLILDGVDITCEGTAPIYCKKADKVFLTMAAGSKNTITNQGAFVAIDDNNIDGAIFSKCDLTFNGSGTLNVTSQEGHGIVTKDDLKVTSGTYVISAGKHGVSGKDSIRIAEGNLHITCGKDGLHSGNDEDADKGYVYVEGGKITVNAEDDGIHGESKVLICGGEIDIKNSYEGIEAAVIEITDGDIRIVSKDDGVNATYGSGGAYLLISGGKIVVNAAGDGLDSNGFFRMTGGEVYVSGPENAGNGALDYESTGEITGGRIVAAGATGMAVNFSSATQGSALITTSSRHNAGDKVELRDAQGNVLLSYTPESSFQSVVVSCPEMKENGTYTLSVGTEIQEFTLNGFLYGNSQGFGGFGGGGRHDRDSGFGNRGERGDEGFGPGIMQIPDDFNPDNMEPPEGFNPGDVGGNNGKWNRDGLPEGMQERPEGGKGGFSGKPDRQNPDNQRNSM